MAWRPAETTPAKSPNARAPDALFSAGSAHLKVENFSAARVIFAALVAGYPKSRLADDGQYWIGHTYEYRARSLGKLDRMRIILKRRSLGARRRMLGDSALLARYSVGIKSDGAGSAPADPADALGVLASGSIRDRVNADLLRAVAAYREVVVNFKTGDMAGRALLRIGTIYTDYLQDGEKGSAAFKELLTHYPGSKEAVGALFQVGVYQLDKGKFDEAIESFGQFVYSYPTAGQAAEALLAIARCHVEMKDWVKALDAYQRYTSKFPKAAGASFANAQIQWIRTYHF